MGDELRQQLPKSDGLGVDCARAFCCSIGVYSIRRFEKLFFGGNEEIIMIAVDIGRGLFAGLDYFVSTQGKCVVLVSNLSSP